MSEAFDREYLPRARPKRRSAVTPGDAAWPDRPDPQGQEGK